MEQIVILASHGRFASGILHSLELICGKKQSVVAIDCYVEETFDLTTTVDTLMQTYKHSEVIVITDIFGGSVNNEFLRYIQQPNFYLIAGLNLPLLIELTTQFQRGGAISETIHQTLANSKEMIQFCNDSVEKEIEEEEF
ncbi:MULTISPECIES: PTS sugar transporter subunit IIA [Enterococcus]|uniref:PTS sugar transporter subunit IIA n=1 Tax=Enterococcus TaxID=1350 RepID=UPI0008249A30|nr:MULTISPECIES: PTS mannose transporter subunit IIA [Enterococcus]GEN18351.1 PTS mannose transporter subunit IIA [Ligilactobacillus acidipiscis]AUB54381.1 PTS mannose transporter subunit IIA [Enterococcus mundtii]MDB7087235.1 PTS mannose transporter subunit IIA [Enterococcus mundtii]MZZ59039.1 PTS mannose transporter subunit IIA [Enterococcus mundtii]MZZ61970.1 PTS mannose transporter subunit IIA [Enterococcus mundtii]